MDMEQLFSELDLDATLELVGSAVMVFDRECHLVATNRQFLRMFNMSLADAIDVHEGRTHRIRIQTMEGIPVANPRAMVDRALTGKQIVEDFERVFPCEGKPHMVVRACVTPLLGRNGRVIGAIKLIREVTTEYELAQRTREFVRVTSHELRTPTTVLRLQAQGLLRSPERARACAEAIDRATRRIETLSVKLHDIATVAAGQPIAIQPRNLRLDALVSDVVQSLEPAQSARVHTTASPAEVRADPARMREVVEALLDNALRYSEDSASVDVDVGRRDGHAELSVADHGIGIPEEKQRHVFEQFYRAHVDTPFDRGGLGASLYLADQIMKLHGGRIWFESKRGQGSTFHLAL